MDRAPAAGGRRAKMPASAENLSQAAARRIALAAQGFGQPRSAGAPTEDDLVAAVGRLGLVQLDSVNVLCRSHYLPLFARLGRYDRSALDRVTGHSDQADGAGDRAVGLRLVEYWAHQASLIPARLHPLFRWRMGRVDQELWAPVVKVAREQPDLVARALRMVQERGADTGQRDRHRPAGGQARPGQARPELARRVGAAPSPGPTMLRQYPAFGRQTG